jgi:hypothetical protein
MPPLPAPLSYAAELPARVAARVSGHVGARLDPGNGEARRWLEEELSRPAYREHNDPIARLLAAIERFIDSLLNADPSAGGALPAGIAGLVTAGLVALVLFALRHVRREARRGDVGGPALLGEERLTAEQFRERSRRALDEGRYAAAVLDAMRAIAQGAAERTLLDDAPSLTAHEVGLQLAASFPAQRDELAWAADLFDAVAYGHHTPERSQAEDLLALEATLRRTRPATRQPVAAGGAS